MHVELEPVRPNWLAAGVLCAVYLGLALVAAWLTTAPLLRGEAPPGRTWVSVVLFDAFFILAALVACYGPLVQVLTRIDSHGVSQLSLGGRKTLAWDQVTAVRASGNALVLDSKQGRIRVNQHLLGGKPLVDFILARTGK